jgi:para-nitrobenzyl esterase
MSIRHLRTRALIVCAFVAAGAFAAGEANAIFDSSIAYTRNGFVQGTVTDDMRVFRGIPYAAPPVGDLRWRPPQPAQHWNGVLDATEFANHCPQVPTPFGTASDTEDCLYLNVYTPRRIGWTKRPVMVWIHGGALYLGESDTYDPARLVEKGVVVVTINYRLGALGFLAHPSLTAESSYGGSGNYGIMDQQAALRWVKRNVRFFGGNPSNVTIFGESAGGLSVHTHLASPESQQLFHRAIIESGAYALDQPDLTVAEFLGTLFASGAGCADQSAACLRSLDVATILATQPGNTIPNLDNHVLTQTIRSALASGEFNRVPVMEGSNHDEWRLFVALDELVGGPLAPEDYVDAIASTLGVDAATAGFIATLYPLADYDSPSEALGAVGTDAIFACNSRVSLGLLSQYVRTYGFEFADPAPPQLVLPPILSFPLGAFHSSELQYLFDLGGVPSYDLFDADQQDLANAMESYWTRFAWFGGPNFFFGPPFWPRYRPETDRILSLAPPTPEVTTGFAADHQCDFWTPPAP